MSTMDSLEMEFVSVTVRDPREHKDDTWHTHVDYEISLHTNSLCFRMKTSCVRRRYSEFVWLRQRLEHDYLVSIPKLPCKNPFFNIKNPAHVNERMTGLREFLEAVLQMPLLLSDSRLHLFLQSGLSVAKLEACARGQTRYSVARAIQRYADGPRPRSTEVKVCSSFNLETSTSSSGLGRSICTPDISECDSAMYSQDSEDVQDSDSDRSTRDSDCSLPDCDLSSIRDSGTFSCLSKSPNDQERVHP